MLEYSMHWHNAAFVEVKVDEDLGTTQVVDPRGKCRDLRPHHQPQNNPEPAR